MKKRIILKRAISYWYSFFYGITGYLEGICPSKRRIRNEKWKSVSIIPYVFWKIGSIFGKTKEEIMLEKQELKKRTRILIDEVFKKKAGSRLSYCKENVEWQFNHLCGYGITCLHVRSALRNCMENGSRINYIGFRVQEITEQINIVSGMFCIEHSGRHHQKPGTPYDAVICMENGMAVSIHIFGKKEARICCRVDGYNEVVYFPEIDEVLYLEAARNHVIWHCLEYEIEGRGPLKRCEEKLPDEFVRIQRGYLVNVRHLSVIRHNEVIMDNGDILPVPYRIFADVKKRLLEKKESTASVLQIPAFVQKE